jgi:hypothetical protein
MKKFILTTLILMLSKNLYGGGIGGGGNPPLLDTPGDGLSAFTYNSITSNSYSGVRNLQDRFNQSMARTAISILPGTLPFLENDFTSYIEPQVETTPFAGGDGSFRLVD